MTEPPRVPLQDLGAQLSELRDEVIPALLSVVESHQFVLGPVVERFERDLAAYLGIRHAVSCASGTDALWLALTALDLQPGDEVITTPFTFFATAGAIAAAGGTPVFADIDARTFNIDPAAIEAAVTPRTRALLPVHLFGQMADMSAILDIAARHRVVVIEDAAQAIGARQQIGDRQARAGTLGASATFSFFPTKNLGAWGDGGLVATDDDDLAARLRRLRAHGASTAYHHDVVGTNSRLDALQAAVLSVKLPRVDGWNAARARHAARYVEQLADVTEVRAPGTVAGNTHTFHQFTIRAQQRDALAEHLRASGIGCGVYYPVPLHRQPCFAHLGLPEGTFPVAERTAREVLSLPVYPQLTQAQQDRVIGAVRAFYA